MGEDSKSLTGEWIVANDSGAGIALIGVIGIPRIDRPARLVDQSEVPRLLDESE